MQSEVEAGKAIADLVRLHREFVEGCFALIRFAQGQLARRGFKMLQGAGIARNGAGSALQTSSEWVISYLGAAFVPQGARTEAVGGSVQTIIPEDGLRTLILQIRWLDKSDDRPPIIWIVDALAKSASSTRPCLEPYYWNIIGKLEPNPNSAAEIREVVSRVKRPEVVVTGRYIEVPLIDITSEQAAIERLIEPAVGFWAGAD